MPILSVTSLLFTEVAFSATATSNPFQNSEKAPNSNLANPATFLFDLLCRRRVELGLSLCPPRLLPLPRPSAAANSADATWVGRFGRTTERRRESGGANAKRPTQSASVTPHHMCAFSWLPPAVQHL